MDRMERKNLSTLIECIQLSSAGAKGTLINKQNIAWQDVVKAFVDGWAAEYKAANP